MDITRIDDRFSTTGQIRPDDLADLKAQGFSAVICARPDDEDPEAPDFAEIEKTARALGMQAAYIPISAMPLATAQVEAFDRAMAEMDGPVLGYCKSGARAGALYRTRDRS